MDMEGDYNQEATTTKPQLACTRTLDNHFDPKVHEKPWMAAGCLRDYKYEYSDSGLGFLMNKQLKLKNFKERHEQIKEVEELNRKSRGLRHFREYDNVCNNEIVITIEYCTNCKQHQGSTRHDEQKYAHFANTLKREIVLQYPIVKVILKPLIFEQNDQSTEALYLRSRLGAFEVQLFSKDNKGEVTKKYVFSKLRTRNWPNVPNVVDDISTFLPASDFAVQLVDPNYDSEEIKEENESESHTSSQRRIQANRLKGMYVVLRPIRNTPKSSFGLTETSSNVKGYGESSRLNLTTSSRPASAMVRPQSGVSTTSNKSKLSAKKHSSGGENNPTASSTPKEYIEQTDNHGVVLFKKVPHNLYEIEVLETHNYLPEKRVVNIFDMVERGEPLEEHILLKEQTMGFIRLKLVENYTPFTDASIIVAKRNPDANSKTAVLREKDPKSGVYEFMIDPGAYILSISKAGFGERKEELIANRGVNDFVLDLGRPSGYNPNNQSGHSHHTHNQYPQTYQNNQKQVEPAIIAERPNTGSRQRPSSSKGRHEPQGISAKPASKDYTGTTFQGASDVSQKPKIHQDTRAERPHDIGSHEEGKPKERVKSALVKKAEFCVLDIDTGKPIIGASVILEEIGFKGTTNEQGKCLVPISKVNRGKLILDHESYFGMVEEYGDEDVEFKNTSEKKFNLIPRPNDIHEVQMRFLPGSGVRCAKFSVLYDKDDQESKKDFVVHHGEGGREIIILRNLLKKHGVFRIIAEVSNLDEFMNEESMFILSHYADCDQLYIFPPTEELYEGQKIFWDVGFFANPVVNPQFVEINGYSNKEISVYSSLKDYQKLLNYLHNSKSDMKTVLGFKDKRRIEKDDDVFIPKEAIYASLDKYGLEIKNLDHLLASACTPEGLYSFRECERRFASLRPPFNFVKIQGKKDSSSSSEGEGGSGEGDEEYLFEDDHE